MTPLEYMERSIDSTDERTVFWKLSCFESKYKAIDLIHAAVDIADAKLRTGRTPDVEIEYVRSKMFFIARIKAVSAEGFVARFTNRDGRR